MYLQFLLDIFMAYNFYGILKIYTSLHTKRVIFAKFCYTGFRKNLQYRISLIFSQWQQRSYTWADSTMIVKVTFATSRDKDVSVIKHSAMKTYRGVEE
jgi:hypothetical protein